MKFEPHKLIKNPHLQTIIADVFSNEKWNQKFEEIHLKTPDDDTLIIDYYAQAKKTKACVILAHGLTGDSKAHYCVRLGRKLYQLGYSVAILNHRNCGKGLGLAKNNIYHSGKGDDLGLIVEHFRKLTQTKVITVGFSMSANINLSLVSKETCHLNIPDRLPDYAICVNPPVNLMKTSESLNKGFSKVYKVNFINKFKKMIQYLEQEKIIDKYSDKIKLTMSFKEFDRIYTAPRGSFNDENHYYETASTHSKYQNIKTPTFILSSADDPFIDATELQDFKNNPNIEIEIQNHGGHLGYLSNKKTRFNDYRWMDERIIDKIEKFIGLPS